MAFMGKMFYWRAYDLDQRLVLKEFGIDTVRILLGAAWVDEDAWREFLRYPECLFVDTTHGTNNEY